MSSSAKKFHVGDNGPGECGAQEGNCPFGKDAPHYPTMKEARDHYENMLARGHNGNIGTSLRKPVVELHVSFGVMRVEDGNLDDPKTRTALITGLCGDMAQAIRRKTGGDVFFVCYDYAEDEGEKFVRDISENPERIHEVSTHAMIESPTAPGRWVASESRAS